MARVKQGTSYPICDPFNSSYSDHLMDIDRQSADRLAGNATITPGSCQGRSEVLTSLRHYLQAQRKGHHTIDCLEEKGAEEKGNNEGNRRERVECLWALPSTQIPC